MNPILPGFDTSGSSGQYPSSVIGTILRSDSASTPARPPYAAWILAVGALDLGFEQFIVLPILPAVQRDEQTTLAVSAWLVTGFLLAGIVAVPVLGRLGDLYGKRRLLLVSLGAFAVGSLVCALSGSITGLIVGRAIQGLGAALGPLTVGLARDYARERAPVWIGLLIGASGAGAAAGLLLGGVFADHLSVAAVFWFLLAVSAVLLAAVWLFVPETRRKAGARPDWLGSTFLGTALFAALLAISEGNNWGWSSLRVIGLFVAAGALLAAFVVVERSTPAPMIDLRLLARRQVWSADLTAFAMGFALFIAGVVTPQVVTLPPVTGFGLGLSYTETGLLLTPGALAIVAGGWASGALVRRVGTRALAACGAVLAGVGYALLAGAHDSVTPIVAGNVAIGAGIGLAIPAVTNLVIATAGGDVTTIFAATTAVSRSVGAALGAQVAAAVVIGAHVAGSRFPSEQGFTRAFVLGLVAAVGALAATLTMPRRADDPCAGPALARPQPERIAA